jgi:hypothetical protein
MHTVGAKGRRVARQIIGKHGDAQCNVTHIHVTKTCLGLGLTCKMNSIVSEPFVCQLADTSTLSYLSQYAPVPVPAVQAFYSPAERHKVERAPVQLPHRLLQHSSGQLVSTTRHHPTQLRIGRHLQVNGKT